MDKILEQLDRIEFYSKLSAKEMLTQEEAAVYIGISRDHLYKLMCARQVPHYKPRGKMTYFRKSELNDWMAQGKVMTEEEALTLAYQHIAKTQIEKNTTITNNIKN